MPDKKNDSADTACTQERNIELEAASHLLTPQEKSLCIQLDLEPTAYLTQKTMVIDAYLENNRRLNVLTQSERQNKILHYLVTNGLIAAN